MIRLAIVHPVQARLDQVAHVLAGEADLEVAACLSVAEEAQRLLNQDACDLFLISASLPGNAAQALVETITQHELAPPLLVTEAPEQQAIALYWMEAGAAGVVFEGDGWAEMVKKIRAAVDGESLLDPDLTAALMERIAELRQLARELDGSGLSDPEDVFAELTPREQEVLKLIGQNMSNQAIASALVIELGTVKNHVHNILRKLDVHNRQQAAQVAEQIRQVDPLSTS